MNETLYKEEKLRKFLLGDVSEKERDAIEDRFLADEDFSAQLLVVEDELIEDYLKSEISSPKERDQFEKAFLTNPRRRDRVVAMKALLKAATAEANLTKTQYVKEKSPSLWTALISSLRFENVYARYALACAALIIFLSGAWLFVNKFNQNSNTQIAQNTNAPQPLPTASVSSDSKDGKTNPAPQPLETPTPPAPQPKPQPKTEPAGLAVTTLVLRSSLVRDPGAGKNNLVISPSNKTVQLQLNLERNDYKSYKVSITTVDGRSVGQFGPIRSRKNFISISIPVKNLPPDDYIAELSGVSEAGPPESFAEYFFSIRRK